MNQKLFANNRQKLLESLPQNSVACVAAAVPMQASNDANFPFRQDSNFWYLTGIDQPGCVVVLETMQNRALLFIPGPDEFRDLWLGGTVSMEQAKTEHGFEHVFYDSEMSDIMKHLIAERTKVMTPDYDTYADAKAEPNSGPKRMHNRLRRYGAKDISSLTPLLTKLRMVKAPEEIAQIEANVRLTLETFDKVEQVLPQATNERDIAALFTYEFMRNSARHAYNPIIGSGYNACTIHYERNDAPLEEGSLVLIDAGAERNYYHADITRTFPVNGTFTARQQMVYDMVEKAQRYALDILKPGVELPQYERDVRTYIHKLLKQNGLLSSSSTLRDTLEFFPHAASHHLGLDVHDTADLERPLEANMVVTVEPGIYLPEEGIGVRIEDDVLITETGCRVLG